MLKEYFYDKYSINTYWDRNSKDHTATKQLRSNNFREIEDWVERGMYDKLACRYTAGPEEGQITSVCFKADFYSGSGWSVNGFEEYEMINTPFNGLDNYKLRMINWGPKGPRITIEDAPVNRPRFKYYKDVFLEGYILKQYGKGYGGAWRNEAWMNLKIDAVKELIPYTAYQHKIRGSLLEEDVIQNENYPVNGIKNGFWWFRKGEYTIPAPELREPENAFLVNATEGDEFPQLVFRLKKRHAVENLKYHAKIEVGRTSDFIKHDVLAESRLDQTGWEYYNGYSWVQFPSEGVAGDTLVRYTPNIEELEFGFYYWTATAFHWFWSYGLTANPRVIVCIEESDLHYYMVINGRPYKALDLKIEEACNGEVGSIKTTILNNNI